MTILICILLAFNVSSLCAVVALIVFLRYFVYDFLAYTERLENAQVLVVEGWMEERSLSAVIAEFEGDRYRQVVTIGGPIRIGALLTGHHTLADVTAANLCKLGFSQDHIVVLPSPDVAKNQTQMTAHVFQQWASTQQPLIQRINIYSSHIHARRTLFLYRNTVPSSVQVGVISSRYRPYNQTNWWKTSYGFKTVIMELIAYGYVRLQHWRSPRQPCVSPKPRRP